MSKAWKIYSFSTKILLFCWLLACMLPTFGAKECGFMGCWYGNGYTQYFGYQCFLYALAFPWIALSQGYLLTFVLLLIALIPTCNCILLMLHLMGIIRPVQLFVSNAVLFNVIAAAYWIYWVFKYHEVGPQSGFVIWLISTIFINAVSCQQQFHRFKNAEHA